MGREMGFGREIGLGWDTELERDFLQAGCPSLSAHTQTHRHTEVKTVYRPVSLRSLGGYNNTHLLAIFYITTLNRDLDLHLLHFDHPETLPIVELAPRPTLRKIFHDISSTTF